VKYRIGGHFQRHHPPSRSLVEQFLAIAALARTTECQTPVRRRRKDFGTLVSDPAEYEWLENTEV
jgi:hypothetical protein